MMTMSDGLRLRGMVAAFREFTSKKDGRRFRVVTLFGDLVLCDTVICQVDGYDVFVDSSDYVRGEVVELPARLQYARDSSGRPVLRLYVDEGVR